MPQHMNRGGLSVRAGHASEPQLPHRPVVRGGRRDRGGPPAVSDDDRRQPGAADVFDDCGGGAGVRGVLEKRVSIAFAAAYRDEEPIGGHTTTVVLDGRDHVRQRSADLHEQVRGGESRRDALRGYCHYRMYLSRTSDPADATAPAAGSVPLAEGVARASCTRKPAECRDRTASRRLIPRTSGTPRGGGDVREGSGRSGRSRTIACVVSTPATSAAAESMDGVAADTAGRTRPVCVATVRGPRTAATLPESIFLASAANCVRSSAASRAASAAWRIVFVMGAAVAPP